MSGKLTSVTSVTFLLLLQRAFNPYHMHQGSLLLHCSSIRCLSLCLDYLMPFPNSLCAALYFCRLCDLIAESCVKQDLHPTVEPQILFGKYLFVLVSTTVSMEESQKSINKSSFSCRNTNISLVGLSQFAYCTHCLYRQSMSAVQ